jgi:hypothetical protein
MKIAWTRLKGACLLLLGLATAGGGRGFAADIDTQSFAKLAETSSATTAGKAAASPFKDESAATPAKAVPAEPGASPSSSPSPVAGIPVNNDSFAGAPGQFWFRGEYLCWWTSGAHLPMTVATQDTTTGVFSNLYGDRDIRSGTHEGYRINLGAWLDGGHSWGVEGDYFDLSGRPDGYDSGFTNGYAGNNAGGAQFPIVRPYVDPALAGIQANGIGYPNIYTGRITVDTGDYFQSAGLWLRHELRSGEWSTNHGDTNWTDSSARTFRLDAIGGYRFTRLIDYVNIQNNEVDTENPAAYPGGTNGLPGALYSQIDSYRTVNNFNGCELGLNAVFTSGRWSLDIVSKTAFGVNNQYARLYNLQSVSENPNYTGGDGAGNFVSTIGATPQEFSRNRFSAIPELILTAGYQVTDHLKVTAGYDLLYWTAVVRAADQIAVDPATGVPLGSLFNTNLTPPPSLTPPSTLPPFVWNESHFLAQGLHLGAEFRF